MKPDYKKIRDAVFALCERNAKEVSQLYDDAIMEIAQAMKGLEIDENQPFNFEDYGLQDKVDDIMDRLEASITNKVRDGVVAAYGMSYANCEALIKYAVGEHVSDKVMKRFLPKLRAEQAANAFMKNVPTPSGKLWNGETLALMTSAVEDAIKQGMSASKMATQIKKYLLDPDDWHRRFRYKVGEDEEGNSIYGRKWKKREWDETTKRYYWVDHKPGEPHPGHVGGSGAYRSSYKNALRYARTTTNIAYRTADYDQYQELPFVIGIEIKLSNNHPVPDICDDLAGVYPKDFKWTGWHPNCRCYQVPALAKMKEVAKMVDAILDDEDPYTVPLEGVISDVPDNFKGWLTKNEERMSRAVSMPYFIRDNTAYISTSLGDTKLAKELINRYGTTGAKHFSSPFGGKFVVDITGGVATAAIQGITSLINAFYEAQANKDRTAILQKMVTLKEFNKLTTHSTPKNSIYGIGLKVYDRKFKEGEIPANLAIAKKMTAKGYDVYLLPNPNSSVSADFILRKDGKLFYYEGKTLYGKNSLDHRLSKGAHQADRTIVNVVSSVNARYVAKEVKRAFVQNRDFNEVILLKGSRIIVIRRKDAMHKSFDHRFLTIWNKNK